MTNAHETVTNNSPQVIEQKPDNKSNRNYSNCIPLKKAIENYKAQLSGFTENKNTGYFLDAKDPDTKKFIEQAQKEIEQCISADGIIDGSIELRGRRANAFALRVPLKGDKGSFSADKFFDSKFCKESEPKITAVTLYTTPDQIRGLRISQDDKGVRLYEVINGSYTVTFNWEVEGKDCSIAMSISADGKVTYSNPSKSLDVADLEKNKNVNITIGEDQPKKLTLKELFLLDPRVQKRASGEVIRIDTPPSSSLESTGTTQTNAKKASLST